MKAFVISLIILIAIMALTVTNAIYINNKSEDFHALASLLTPETNSEFFVLYDEWKKAEGIFSITISHKDIDNLNIALSVLKQKYENKEDDGFYEYKALLMNYISEIRDKEAFALDNII
ncbi:MAG: DUF4363 family protein [Clostridia bacterium]|nr:DUF4363 family protein [Clostridia bacterium]MBQ7789311.1 DUF4363 family protein [Clostridia bacterium]